MAITFALRSDQLEPRFVTVITQTIPFRSAGADTLPAAIADSSTGLIGSKIIDVDKQTGSYRTVRYIGSGNVPDMSTGISILARVVPTYTGSPGVQSSIFLLSGFGNQPYFMLYHKTDGTVAVLATNAEMSSTMLNVSSVSTWSPTAGTAYDVVLTWDGTTGANGVEIFIDNSSLIQGTGSLATTFSSANGTLHNEVHLASGWGQGNDGEFDYNEMVIWNSVINPNSVTLTSGSGALAGASRTAFVDVTAADALPASTGGATKTILGGPGFA